MMLNKPMARSSLSLPDCAWKPLQFNNEPVCARGRNPMYKVYGPNHIVQNAFDLSVDIRKNSDAILFSNHEKRASSASVKLFSKVNILFQSNY